MPTTPDFEQMLRGTALRMTRPRLAVLSAVHELPHPDTASIIDPPDDHGFAIDEAEVGYRGRRPERLAALEEAR